MIRPFPASSSRGHRAPHAAPGGRSADLPAVPASPRCSIRDCGAAAPFAPVLLVVVCDSDHVSRVRLPVQLCAEHRAPFERSLLGPERRASMERAMTSRGHRLPDWARTAVEFVAV